MANLWYPDNLSTTNTTELAMVFNKVLKAKKPYFVNTLRQMSPVMMGLMGKPDVNPNPGGMLGIERVESITGKDFEWPLLGRVPSPDYVADSAQTDSVTLSWDDNMFNYNQVSLAHLTYHHPVPSSEFLRYKGPEAKVNFVDATMAALFQGWHDKLANGVGDDPASATTASRSMIWAMSRQIAGATPATPTWDADWGRFDRTDANNINLRGNLVTGGDLTIAKFRSGVNAARTKGGQPTFAVCGQTRYEKLQGIADSFTQVVYDEDKEYAQFGHDYVRIGKTRVALDPYFADTAAVAILSPTSWRFAFYAEGFEDGALVKDFTKKATWVIPQEVWCQLICLNPRENSYIHSITS